MIVASAFPFFFASAAFAGANGEPGVSISSSAATRERSEPSPEPERLAIGVNDLGGQLRFHVAPNWAAEFRFLTGSSSSNVGNIHSTVFGLRGYRFFRERRRCKLYVGVEGGYAQTSIRGSGSSGSPAGNLNNGARFGNTSGYAGGGFGGIELRPLNRVAIDADMGPYLIGLKEKITGASDSSWDFVLNAAVNVYLF